ncbi:MAG: hypothetical protein J6Y15_10780, partial [Bacteroidaceae bacterium]|nr:hypothetical protein [Bacteroidaceae bacterium]
WLPTEHVLQPYGDLLCRQRCVMDVSYLDLFFVISILSSPLIGEGEVSQFVLGKKNLSHCS